MQGSIQRCIWHRWMDEAKVVGHTRVWGQKPTCAYGRWKLTLHWRGSGRRWRRRAWPGGQGGRNKRPRDSLWRSSGAPRRLIWGSRFQESSRPFARACARTPCRKAVLPTKGIPSPPCTFSPLRNLRHVLAKPTNKKKKQWEKNHIHRSIVYTLNHLHHNSELLPSVSVGPMQTAHKYKKWKEVC